MTDHLCASEKKKENKGWGGGYVLVDGAKIPACWEPSVFSAC